jgi:leucyl aminopeptidase (aminopeptidase T)
MGARIASLPNFTERMMPALDINYRKLERVSSRLATVLRKGRYIHLTTPYGTDVKFNKTKFVFSETPKDGFFNMPLGEVGTSPSRMNGVLVINSYQNLIKQPTRLIIKNNRIVEFEKSRNGSILKNILSVDKNARYAAEFAIGTNKKAKLIYNVLQDEKILGTCHIAFGTNISFHGRRKSKVHIDLMIFRPTIKIDGKIIMKDGKPGW